MSEQAPQFLTYDQAIEAAKKAPDVEFIGLRFDAPYRRLDVYFIDVDSSELDYVNIAYEGGELFSSCGEEGFYGEDDAPVEAKNIFYVREQELGNPQIRGMTSEYMLCNILPGLNAPDTYPNKASFTKDAARAFSSFWRQA